MITDQEHPEQSPDLEKHNLPSLEERRRQLRLCFFYKVTQGLLPSMPPDQFIKSQRPARRIRPSRNIDLDQNPIANHIRNHSNCYQVPESRCPQYKHKHSFFPRTVSEWNQLDESTVHQKSVASFKNALIKERNPEP